MHFQVGFVLYAALAVTGEGCVCLGVCLPGGGSVRGGVCPWDDICLEGESAQVGLLPGGCLPTGCVCLGEGGICLGWVSTKSGVCLGGGVAARGVSARYPPPRGQNERHV